MSGQCTFRPERLVDGKFVYGDQCPREATETNYGDQGRYVHPVCVTHWEPGPTGMFKGPEDP